MTAANPFQQAISNVAEWLDGEGCAFAHRVVDGSRIQAKAAWEIGVPDTPLAGKPVRLVLPNDFPASCARIYADEALCLVLPHIEEDGRLCLGVEPSPADYVYPCEAVERVIHAFEAYLTNASDPDWVADELHNERLSYWLRFCDKKRRAANGLPAARLNVVCLDEWTGHTEGSIAVYSQKGPSKRPAAMVACMGKADPQALAQRHRWANGTLTKGRALFVHMPPSQLWTPATWPETLEQLDSLVSSITAGGLSLVEWLRERIRGGSQPFLVVLVQEGVAYGYQIHPADVWQVQSPRIQPLSLVRVDANWSLSRDHGLSLLSMRRRKRIAVLGCGSLGSPVIELLARAGVGYLEIIDNDLFEAENCSRHVLGLSSIHKSKVAQLAERLRTELPGVEIRAQAASATAWIAQSCRPGDFDLVVDCTAESSVRVALAQYRDIAIGVCPVIHAWVEPFCAAAHVVSVHAPDSWPLSDPADQKINIAEWTESTRVNLPACSAGFHPYGVADVWQAAGFAAERLLAVLDGTVGTSTIWSWVRSRAYFESLSVDAVTGKLVPDSPSPFDAAMLTRDFLATVGADG
ncbi:ThiF family adenylyltransferase [Noviherbaspirillum pedocola]|uniref:ThiF family adenylyltransferase n=1 Tax=Noviherbaspirillum pedocola TaxID=2801341 RepID=A0A934SSG2_9BURK|nr:ThiF family adenylyltransferase [Noviherbaspirillum pedocola]MBK4734689.1 ThiF family adenylyltransferase [Noviherbaspirillum pedocola]